LKELINKANILTEALPYIQKLNGKTVVIKYGGNAMTCPDVAKSIMQDITLLKYVGVNPVIVHGGGPEINNMLQVMNIQSSFHNGLRITDEATIEVVQMVLTGKINKDIVTQLNQVGGKAIGICGKDGCLIEAEKMEPVAGVDLGLVGKVKNVNSKVLEILAKDDYIPVVAPIGTGPGGRNI
jgi:acetylglutamate kinase